MNRTILAVTSLSLRATVAASARAVQATVLEVQPEALSSALATHEIAVAVVDILLPQGMDLVRTLREVAPDVPLIVFTAWWGRPPERALVEARVVAALFRPVDENALTEVLGTLLPEPSEDRTPQWRVLVVDDDEVGLKLIRLRLTAAGFDVIPARNGELGFAAAQAHLPDAIVCDVLMAHLDGFGFTQRVRQDPELAHTPVILITANYVGAHSQQLGIDCGADAYLERSATLREVIEALTTLRQNRSPVRLLPTSTVDDRRMESARDLQIDKLIRVNVTLGRRRALSDTALAILGATATAIAVSGNRKHIHGHILQLCVDSGAIVLAVLYLRRPDGTLFVEGAAGEAFMRSQSIPKPETVTAMIAGSPPTCEVIALPGSMVAESATRAFLVEAKTASALIVPLRVGGEDLGVLVLGSDLNDIAAPDWRTFGRTLSSQLALSLLLLMRAQER